MTTLSPTAMSGTERRISMSRSGRWLLIARGGEIDLVDTFEGVAILTSNLDGAIDPAFKRRMSLRLQFPSPDEETRLRLWAGHVTPETPTLGDFDFSELARRFPLSGGYIRNCTLRAAFLAAHEGRPMRQEHLLRAVQLEYREMGKLSTSSRLE